MAESSIWSPGDSGGPPGPPGTAATIQVGTVTTGAAGSNATIVNSGDTTNAVFNFTIPRGDTGIGAQGPVGPPGPSVQGPPGVQGNPGIQGAPGSVIIAGSGIPPTSTGVNGDYFLDQPNAFLYGPKAGEFWPGTFINLRPFPANFEDFAPLTGTIVNVSATTTNAILTLASTLATLTVNLPAASVAINGQVVEIFFQAFGVTALTVQSTGATIRGVATSSGANSTMSFKFRLSNNTWYKTV